MLFDLQELRLVVDHCIGAPVTEDIDSSSSVRSGCEATGSSSGEKYLLNVLTPLELGGRSVEYSSSLPNNNNFEGCIKNMRVNDKVGVHFLTDCLP